MEPVKGGLVVIGRYEKEQTKRVESSTQGLLQAVGLGTSAVNINSTLY